MMFDGDDERRMKSGELMQIPGQHQTFVTFEPKRTYRKHDALPHITTAKPRLLTDGRFTCAHCGRQCTSGPGKFQHERACARSKARAKREANHA